MSRDWDATTYDRVSTPHRAWAGELLDRLALTGSETVLDAGCGSGAVTAKLLERVPEGKVYAVDVAPSMVEHTRSALGDRRGVTVLLADLTELVLPEPVDAIFSSATFHWIPDHATLFGAMYRALVPGGRLVAQCGGFGNIDAFRVIADRVAFEEEPYAPYFKDWVRPWNYATPEDTLERLGAAGFVDREAWLVDMPTPIDDPPTYAKTVVLVRHVDTLPTELQDRFVERVLSLCETPFVLDYVRLNLVAVKPA